MFTIFNKFTQMGQTRFLCFWILFYDGNDGINYRPLVLKSTLEK